MLRIWPGFLIAGFCWAAKDPPAARSDAQVQGVAYRLLLRPTLTGGQPRGLRKERLAVVFQADRHIQARHHPLHAEASSLPQAHVRQQR